MEQLGMESSDFIGHIFSIKIDMPVIIRTSRFGEGVDNPYNFFSGKIPKGTKVKILKPCCSLDYTIGDHIRLEIENSTLLLDNINFIEVTDIRIFIYFVK